MNPYLATKYTVPEGYGHPLFSPVHIATLAFIALLAVSLSLFYRKSSEERRRYIRKIIAVLLIIDELVKDVNALLTGQWNWNLLPLHLCSVNIFIIAYEAFTDSDVAKNYLYGICIPASISALIFPSWMTVLPYFSLMSMHSWSVHALLFIYPVLLLSGGFIPSWRVFFKAKDKDQLQPAFKEFTAMTLGREKRPTIRERLVQAQEQAKTKHREREKVKTKDREVAR